MSELISSWADLVLLGSVQNLPLLCLACLLDRIFARLAWITPRRVVWAVVVIELLLPPALGAPMHVAGSDALSIPLEGQVALIWPAVLFVVWLTGSLALALLTAARMRRVRANLLADAQELPAELQPLMRALAHRVGLRDAPRIVISPEASSPCVLGTWRPIVCIDLATLTASGEQLEHALLHEFGHVRRRDGLRAMLVRGFVCSWWFHPSAWLAAKRFALFREAGCDRLVTRLLGARTAYCHTLAGRVLGAPAAAPALAFVSGPADVVQRVMALRHSGKHRIARTCAATFATALLMMCCVPLTASVARHLPFGVESITDVPGCVTKHYYMLSLLANQPAGPTSSDTPVEERPDNPR